MKTALYRHFDVAGALLYIGISLSAVQRLAQHKHRSHWFESIVRVTIEWHATRDQALAAEARAIAEESPAHNVARPAGPLPDASDAVVTQLAGWAILHPASGRRDGNYFFDDDVREMLVWWGEQFPAEHFELVRGTLTPSVQLRPHDADEWRSAS